MKKEKIDLKTESEPVSGGIGIQKYENPEDVFNFLHGSWGEEACAYIEKKAAIKRVQSDARHFLQRLTHHTHTIVEQ